MFTTNPSKNVLLTALFIVKDLKISQLLPMCWNLKNSEQTTMGYEQKMFNSKLPFGEKEFK